MKKSILKLTFSLLLLVTCTTLFAQRYFPTVDTYIEQNSPTVVENTTNPGKLVIRNIGGSQRISFLEFNIADFSEQVSKAELCLYFYAVTNSGIETVDVYEVTSGIIANDITWTGFTGNYTLASTPITSLDIPATAIGWCRFDIKSLVNTIAATAGTNKKIRLAIKSRTTNLLMNFYSVDQTTYPHYQPFLIMTLAPATDLVEKSRTTVAQDGYVYNSAPDSKYDEQWLYINYYKNGTSKQYRYTNLRFNIPTITLNENNRVTIKTKVYGAQCDANIVYVVDLLGVDNLNDATDVNNLTWNTMPVTGNYTYLRSRFFSLDDKNNETNIEWDVTNYVKAQQTAGKNFVNFSLQIPELGGYVGHNIALYASNYLNLDPNSTNIPQLIVYGSSATAISTTKEVQKFIIMNGNLLTVSNTKEFTGSIINTQGIAVKNIQSTSTFDTSTLNHGVYFLKLQDNTVLKFIKNK